MAEENQNQVNPETINSGEVSNPIDTSKLFAKDVVIPEGEVTQEMITQQIEGKLPPAGDDKSKPPAIIPTLTEDFKDLPEKLQSLPAEWKFLAKELHSAESPYEPPEAILTGKNAKGEELTPQERYELLVQEIQAHTETENPMVNDPFVARYMTLRNQQGFDAVKFFENERQTYEVLQMAPKDYMTLALTQTGKYTKEAIDDHIAKMNPLDLETQVRGMKQNFVQSLVARDQQELQAYNQSQQQTHQQIEQQEQQFVQNWLTKQQQNRKYYGFELSEADNNQFRTELPQLMKRDPQTGVNKIDAFLQSDESYLELAPLVWLAMNGKMPGYISDLKEAIKAEIEKKAGIHGVPDGGGINPGGVDANKLYGRT